jgi:hypothetical protein
MNASEEPKSEAKLVVDEDWKARAQAEKEALQKAREEALEQTQAATEAKPVAEKPVAEKPVAEKPAPQSDASVDEKEIDFPPASFAVLLGEIGMQALLAIEESARHQGVRKKNLLGAAKLAIDNLDVLEEKCRGNLTSEESQLLARYLQAARLAFVEASSRKA